MGNLLLWKMPRDNRSGLLAGLYLVRPPTPLLPSFRPLHRRPNLTMCMCVGHNILWLPRPALLPPRRKHRRPQQENRRHGHHHHDVCARRVQRALGV
jgi:hypothetical protein